jgi:hypothetical protein
MGVILLEAVAKAVSQISMMAKARTRKETWHTTSPDMLVTTACATSLQGVLQKIEELIARKPSFLGIGGQPEA